jgi:hypothetical protein
MKDGLKGNKNKKARNLSRDSSLFFASYFVGELLRKNL